MKVEEFLLEDFKNMQELIRFMDQKTGAVLVVCGLCLTVFIEFSKPLHFVKSPDLLGVVTAILGIGFSVLFVIELSMVLVGSLKPKLAVSYGDGEQSFFYFEHISKMKKSYFLEKVKVVGIEDELAHQCYEVACILQKKAKNLHSTVRCLYVLIIILLGFILSATNM